VSDTAEWEDDQFERRKRVFYHFGIVVFIHFSQRDEILQSLRVSTVSTNMIEYRSPVVLVKSRILR